MRRKSLRVKILAALARILGIQFKIDGLPYGAAKMKDEGSRDYMDYGTKISQTSIW